MSAVSVLLPLSERQIANLAMGKSVRLSAKVLERMGTGHAVWLTAAQASRIEKCAASRKGCSLSLTKAMMEHNETHGEGLLGDTLRSLGATVKRGVVNGAARLATFGVDRGVDALNGVASSMAGRVVPSALRPWLDKGISLGANYTKDQLNALIEGLRHSVNGSGLFTGAGLYTGTGLFPPGYDH